MGTKCTACDGYGHHANSRDCPNFDSQVGQSLAPNSELLQLNPAVKNNSGNKLVFSQKALKEQKKDVTLNFSTLQQNAAAAEFKKKTKHREDLKRKRDNEQKRTLQEQSVSKNRARANRIRRKMDDPRSMLNYMFQAAVEAAGRDREVRRFFWQPVSRKAAFYAAYVEQIKKPISLSEISQRCEASKYLRLDAFERDVALLVMNAELFNGANTEPALVARRAQKMIVDAHKEGTDERKSIADAERKLTAAFFDAGAAALSRGGTPRAANARKRPRFGAPSAAGGASSGSAPGAGNAAAARRRPNQPGALPTVVLLAGVAASLSSSSSHAAATAAAPALRPPAASPPTNETASAPLVGALTLGTVAAAAAAAEHDAQRAMLETLFENDDSASEE